jgi:hypothetical protein
LTVMIPATLFFRQHALPPPLGLVVLRGQGIGLAHTSLRGMTLTTISSVTRPLNASKCNSAAALQRRRPHHLRGKLHTRRPCRLAENVERHARRGASEPLIPAGAASAGQSCIPDMSWRPRLAPHRGGPLPSRVCAGVFDRSEIALDSRNTASKSPCGGPEGPCRLDKAALPIRKSL